jgi:membrane protein implicated in regulation of membrane protease activity
LNGKADILCLTVPFLNSIFEGANMGISPVLIWFLFGIACFVVELMLPGFVLFFLGIGAWCAAAALAVIDVPLTAQLLIFLASSLLSLILLRARLKSIFSGSSSKEADSVNMNSTPATGVVTDAIIPPADGRVKYGGSFWRATADEPIAEGTVVLIVEKKDLIIKVRALSANKEEAR